MIKRLVALVAALVLLGGCVKLAKPYPDIHYHSIKSEPIDSTQWGRFPLPVEKGSRVVLREFTISPTYDTRQWVILSPDSTTVRRDYYNQYYLLPQEAVRGVVIEKFRAQQSILKIVQPSSLLTADYAIEGHVRRLALVDCSGPGYAVEVELELTLIDLRAPLRAVLANTEGTARLECGATNEETGRMLESTVNRAVDIALEGFGKPNP